MDAVTEVKRTRRLKAGGRKRVAKGRAFGRHIEERTVLGWSFALHATKGWRQESRKRAAVRMIMAQMGYEVRS